MVYYNFAWLMYGLGRCQKSRHGFAMDIRGWLQHKLKVDAWVVPGFSMAVHGYKKKCFLCMANPWFYIKVLGS